MSYLGSMAKMAARTVVAAAGAGYQRLSGHSFGEVARDAMEGQAKLLMASRDALKKIVEASPLLVRPMVVRAVSRVLPSVEETLAMTTMMKGLMALVADANDGHLPQAR